MAEGFLKLLNVFPKLHHPGHPWFMVFEILENAVFIQFLLTNANLE